MVDFIKIDLRGGPEVEAKMLRIGKLPEMTSDVMYQWGKILEKDMKNSAHQADIKPFSGVLFGKGIEWRQRPKGKIGRLFIVKYGLDLDSMKPHYVAFKKSRTRFLRWGLRANSSSIKAKARRAAAGAKKGRSIYVKPHPFVRRGWRRARPKLNALLKSKTDELIGG